MEIDGLKEVYFDEYCKTCEFFNSKEDEEPCAECLNEPVNQYSHKPVKYNKKQNAIFTSPFMQ